MRTKELIIKSSFFLYLISTILELYFKLDKLAGDTVVIKIWILLDIIFIILSISEIITIKKISTNEKNMWITGLIVLTPIAGLIYVFSARKRILKK